MPEDHSRDSPLDIIEVRRNDDETLDEIVAYNCFVHLEQMTPSSWWLGVTKQGFRQVVRIGSADGGACKATSEMDDWPEGASSDGDRAAGPGTLLQRLRGLTTSATGDPESALWRLRAEAADTIEQQRDEIVRLKAALELQTIART